MKTNYTKHLMILILGIFSLQYSMLSIGHEGHAEPVEKTQIVENANKVINMAIAQKKLEPSWKEAKADEPKIVDEEKGGQWVIKFTNTKINKNNELFIFFKLDGKYVAMNHTGK